MVRALARNAAVTHGYYRVSRPQLAPAMDTVIIAVLAGRPRVRRSIPAAIVTVMEAGSSIRPVSTGVQALVVTVVQRIMIMPATA